MNDEAQNRTMADLAKQLGPNSAIRTMSKLNLATDINKIYSQSAINHLAATFNPEIGSTNEIFRRVSDAINASAVSRFGIDAQNILGAVKMQEAFVANFGLPDLSVYKSITKQLNTPDLVKTLASYHESQSSIVQAMKKMESPWLSAIDQVTSIDAFARLQGIGSLISQNHGFTQDIAKILREDLGDWRDEITWTKHELNSFDERRNKYVNLGFNPSITEFPAPAFHQSLECSGLSIDPPELLDTYGSPIPKADNKQEQEAFERTNNAHAWLHGLESHVRRFIDVHMTKQFGEKWPISNLPNNMYDQWVETKRKDKSDRELPILHYADLTDYERIICRKDNWKIVFSTFFSRPEFVRESFQRLYPIRHDIAHSRLITKDDELFLFTETKKLMNIIILQG
ncbi:MAG: hypothetical protein JKX71_04340 [Amylibacter sp.]|nr:hypothetical protein [Amylibacter sp.]